MYPGWTTVPRGTGRGSEGGFPWPPPYPVMGGRRAWDAHGDHPCSWLTPGSPCDAVSSDASRMPGAALSGHLWWPSMTPSPVSPAKDLRPYCVAGPRVGIDLAESLFSILSNEDDSCLCWQVSIS